MTLFEDVSFLGRLFSLGKIRTIADFSTPIINLDNRTDKDSEPGPAVASTRIKKSNDILQKSSRVFYRGDKSEQDLPCFKQC